MLIYLYLLIALTSTMILEVIAAIAELEAGMIAVTGLIAQILDDGINGCLLHHTGRVASIAAELRLPTRATRR